MSVKNICKFPIYIKSIGKQIKPREELDVKINDEVRLLIKENKIENVGVSDETPMKNKKPQKTGNKKVHKSFEGVKLDKDLDDIQIEE